MWQGIQALTDSKATGTPIHPLFGPRITQCFLASQPFNLTQRDPLAFGWTMSNLSWAVGGMWGGTGKARGCVLQKLWIWLVIKHAAVRGLQSSTQLLYLWSAAEGWSVSSH